MKELRGERREKEVFAALGLSSLLTVGWMDKNIDGEEREREMVADTLRLIIFRRSR